MTRTGIPIFDSIAGGLSPNGSHLLYGETGVGKSTFALQFLHWGLQNGESALLVTRRLGSDVLQQAEAFGVPLRAHVRSGKLVILEFTSDVVERAARARDISPIADELDYFLRGANVRRVVIDPLTPVIQGMNVSEKASNIRALVQRINRYKATSVFILDTPEGSDILMACQDATQGVLGFEYQSTGSGSGRLTIERMPGSSGGRSEIHYAIEPGQGIIEAPADENAGAAAQRKILLATGDSETSQFVRQALAGEHEVSECMDMVQGMARIAADMPDLLIVDADSNETDAVNACTELRRNQINLPILVVAGNRKRLRDRIGMLAQGIDDVLDKPVDGRLLRVRVQALLKRYSSSDKFRAHDDDQMVLASLDRPVPASGHIPDANALRACLQEEVSHARRHSVNFSVCSLETKWKNGSSLGTLLEGVNCQMRDIDKVYADSARVTVILSEASEDGVEAFLRRMHAEIGSLKEIKVSSWTFDGTDEFVTKVMSHVAPKSKEAGRAAQDDEGIGTDGLHA